MNYTHFPHLKIKLNDGIIFCEYEEKLLLTLDMAKKMLADRLEFQQGVSYPIVIVLNGLKAADKETRKFTATEGIRGITMGAFIVKSTIEKVILNFFLSVEKPPVPAKAFTTEEDAVQWINEQIDKQ